MAEDGREAMRKRDKRRTIRVACNVDVRIRSHGGWLDARAADLSRSGVRLRFEDGALGLIPEATLLDVARRLGAMLPESIEAELGGKNPVVRRLRVVRIGKRTQAQEGGEVVLGCLFDRPLSDEDARMLGLVLPSEGETWAQAERRLRATWAASRAREKREQAGQASAGRSLP